VKHIVRFAALLVCGVLGSSLTAAEISWGPVFPISADTLNTRGIIAAAINVSNGTLPDITVNGITFSSDQLTFPSATGQGDFFTAGGGTTGNADLNMILDSHAWSGGETVIPLTGLTPGDRYQVQLIGASDTRGCCGDRNLAGSDGLGNVSGDIMRSAGASVIGTFIADSDTQLVSIVPGTVNGVDPGLSAGLLNFIGDPETISINFGADEPAGARSDVTGPAGVLGSANWNNLDLLSGSAANLIDSEGLPTGARVEWTSNNTWASQGRGEDNNTAPEGNNRNLMTGYLDTNESVPNSVTVSDLPFDGPFNVYVYTKGGVLGRGGEYTIGDQTISHVDAVPFDGTFKFGSEGDVLVFEGITGDSFTLTGLPTTGTPPRAPINGIEISTQLVPEPSSIGLLALGMMAFAGLRRKR
jgi:hypothetical protein